MMKILLMRNVARTTSTLRSCSRSPSPSSWCRFFGLVPSAEASPQPSDVENAGAAAAAANVAALNLDVTDRTSSSTVSKPGIPTILQPRVVVYDGVCHLCHRGVKWVINADKHRKIKFCCLQSRAAEPYLRLCGVEKEDVLRRFIFIEGLGQYHQASTAALKVLSYLPFPYYSLRTLLIIPTPLRDAIYDYVAKRRYDWFGKEEDCLVLQEPEMLERFIDAEEILQHRQSDL
ncbi:hypothetical protein Nepgr_003476 [Nepenthes gracilis]|uniref:Thiol-disulfide oxidoreductase DCC n=1 Tax=Nepenthes gracilis TaxID=150966 RepID=A0AAD3RZP8_NEPGR|nr:hypothetical protein Nepgr_003476 [Nepenthes gracilis]